MGCGGSSAVVNVAGKVPLPGLISEITVFNDTEHQLTAYAYNGIDCLYGIFQQTTIIAPRSSKRMQTLRSEHLGSQIAFPYHIYDESHVQLMIFKVPCDGSIRATQLLSDRVVCEVPNGTSDYYRDEKVAVCGDGIDAFKSFYGEAIGPILDIVKSAVG